MRVLHVQKTAGVSGSERHLLSLLPALAARGIEVKMCILATGDAARFQRRMTEVGVETSMVNAGRHFNPALVPLLWREARRFRADVVHTHLVHADLWGIPAARLARARAVSSVHDVANFYRGGAVGAAARLVGRLVHRRIAISQHVADYLQEVGIASPAQTRVIHYGIDTAGWEAAAAQATHMRARLGFTPDDVVFGIASRLVPGKGHATAIDALSIVDDPRVRCVIAGDGPLREELTRQAEPLIASGRLRFLGFVDAIAEVMAVCDALLFPTTSDFSEGFGLAALEAMATGRPVIASDTGPLPEVIDSASGILVREADAGALAAAITELAADGGRRRELGRQALLRAKSEFSLDRMVNQTIEVYERVLTR